MAPENASQKDLQSIFRHPSKSFGGELMPSIEECIGERRIKALVRHLRKDGALVFSRKNPETIRESQESSGGTRERVSNGQQIELSNSNGLSTYISHHGFYDLLNLVCVD